MLIHLRFPEALLNELTAAASESKMQPDAFAAELIEAALAERRLARLPEPRYGAFERRFEDIT